jgi:hypothetical protein
MKRASTATLYELRRGVTREKRMKKPEDILNYLLVAGPRPGRTREKKSLWDDA